MPAYIISAEIHPADRSERIFAFADDDAAIAYALPIARGQFVEIWRDGRLVATVDERPSIPSDIAA